MLLVDVGKRNTTIAVIIVNGLVYNCNAVGPLLQQGTWDRNRVPVEFYFIYGLLIDDELVDFLSAEVDPKIRLGVLEIEVALG